MEKVSPAFPPAKKKEKPRVDSVPPGFQTSTHVSACAAFFQKLCRTLNLSPFWLNIVNTIIAPVLEVIVSQFSTVLSPLFAMMNLNNGN